MRTSRLPSAPILHTGFKAGTEVYAIVEGPRFCLNAFVDIFWGIKFCDTGFIPLPCGIKWKRFSVEIAVRHT